MREHDKNSKLYIETNLKKKLQTPNTYAPCGRNDAARKRRWNPDASG